MLSRARRLHLGGLLLLVMAIAVGCGGQEAEPSAEELAAAARMSGIFTDRDALVALSDGTITRGDARDWLYANPGKN